MTVTLVIPTVTYALKAKKALQRVGIVSKLTKTVSDGENGCQYALDLDDADFYSAIYELKSLNIPYKPVAL